MSHTWRHDLGGLALMVPCAIGGLGCASDDPWPSQTGAAPTFYQHAAPIFESKCVGCHQDGGIGPFSLDDYAAASSRASQIAAYTADRIMPPFLLETGGECGSFDESVALTDEEIATIGAWARGGAREGSPVELTQPALPVLDGATEFLLPEFVPQITGGPLAEFDEYRCFPLPTQLEADTFVTGYDVAPGDARLVHHVDAFVVDPERVTASGQTNQQVMDALHAADPNPERVGWSCFSRGGEGVEIESAPVIWAPGQRIVSFGPHMHERGRKYMFEVAQGAGDYACQGRVNRWDFSWQRLYTYAAPLPFNDNTRFRVTCDYDTSADTEPVRPGWGTQNEMCFVLLMLAMPPGFSL